MPVKELLIGCGNSRERKLSLTEKTEWANLVTLDISPAANPDILWDLNHLPYPFLDEEFDEIHAYEVLEHCGQQGDWRFFFAQWSEFYRILKPDGQFYLSSPMWNGPWAWGDPGHTRLVQMEQFVFLSQEQYKAQIGLTAMTDYREVWKGDFEPLAFQPNEHGFFAVLRAVKPPRA